MTLNPSNRSDDNPPAFNLPRDIVLLAGSFLVVSAFMEWFATPQIYFWVITYFSFIPAAYDFSSAHGIWMASLIWRPLTYSFLHGDWTHVGVNCIWLLAFGSPVARRFGSLRFAAFCVATSVAGVALHFVLYETSTAPVIGASAIVSGCMGAAIRFAFQPAIPGVERHDLPTKSLAQTLTNRNMIVFIVAWFGINWLFGAGVLPVPGLEDSVAWEAHIGGFAAGFLGFDLFDRGRHR